MIMKLLIVMITHIPKYDILPGVYNYKSYLIIGNLIDVQKTMKDLYEYLSGKWLVNYGLAPIQGSYNDVNFDQKINMMDFAF